MYAGKDGRPQMYNGRNNAKSSYGLFIPESAYLDSFEDLTAGELEEGYGFIGCSPLFATKLELCHANALTHYLEQTPKGKGNYANPTNQPQFTKYMHQHLLWLSREFRLRVPSNQPENVFLPEEW